MAAAAVLRKVQGLWAPYRTGNVEGQHTCCSDCLRILATLRISFSTEAWCLSCSNLSWFCLFHLVLQPYMMREKLPLWTPPTVCFGTTFSPESRSDLGRRLRHFGQPLTNIFDTWIFVPGKLAEREWTQCACAVVYATWQCRNHPIGQWVGGRSTRHD